MKFRKTIEIQTEMNVFNKKFLFIMVLNTSCISQSTFATTDYILINSTDNEKIYIRKNTIREIKPNIKKYWIETRFIADINDNEKGLSIKKGEYVKELSEVNCKEDTYKTIEIGSYTADGIFKGTYRFKDENLNIYPGSVMEKIKVEVCN